MWRRDEPPRQPAGGRPAKRRPSAAPIVLALLLVGGLAVAACTPAEGPGAGQGTESGTAAAQEGTISAEDFESGDTGIFKPEQPPASPPAGEPATGPEAGTGESGG